MQSNEKEINWTRRVSRQKIRLLYENDAKGIIDEDLINDVAYGFYARCKAIITVTEASKGRVKCLNCGQIILHSWRKNEILKCQKCSWEIPWGVYLKSYQHKQLHAGAVSDIFKEFMNRLPNAKTPQEKMILIDTIIHECHKWFRPEAKEPLYTRPVAVNLIQGKMRQVMALLNNLAYSSNSTPGTKDHYELWTKNVLSYKDKINE